MLRIRVIIVFTNLCPARRALLCVVGGRRALCGEGRLLFCGATFPAPELLRRSAAAPTKSKKRRGRAAAAAGALSLPLVVEVLLEIRQC